MLSHYTLAVSAAASPAVAYTASLLSKFGVEYAVVSTNQNIYFTTDGATTPVITGGSEVGMLLRSTDAGYILSKEEFLNFKALNVTTAARVQFMFREGNRFTVN